MSPYTLRYTCIFVTAPGQQHRKHLFLYVNAKVASIYMDGLVQERCNSSALAMELHLSYTNPSI